jgi:hypothetical protein
MKIKKRQLSCINQSYKVQYGLHRHFMEFDETILKGQQITLEEEYCTLKIQW